MLSKKVGLAVAGILIGASVTLGLLNAAATGDLFGRVILSNIGSIKAVGVGVYWDSSCSDLVSSIDWGLVGSGATKNVAVYIMNEGSAPVTLSLETENWSPSNALDYMSLTWDYGGQVISVDGVVQVTLSLSVSEAIEGITDFSFDIVILGSG